jgi:hypothetical protein
MPETTHLPKNWPKDVRHISKSIYALSLSSDVRRHIEGTKANSIEKTQTTSPTPVIIRRIDTPTHPAFSQFGLFASCKIHPRTKIIVYCGEIHSDVRAESDYDLSLCRLPSPSAVEGVLSIGIDAAKMGNEARFINDYRGVQGVERPNAEFRELREGGTGELRMSVWSLSEGIKKGEEILVSYGKGWWSSRKE